MLIVSNFLISWQGPPKMSKTVLQIYFTQKGTINFKEQIFLWTNSKLATILELAMTVSGFLPRIKLAHVSITLYLFFVNEMMSQALLLKL